MPPKTAVRVRIAPSPTGFLHIGTARTALFNYLFAKHHGGEFILRIEDTDIERSEKRFEKDIIEGLKWLGITWSEGLYRQSERIAIYEKYLNQLLEERKAYYCFCTKEELEAERNLLTAEGKPPRYSGKCRVLVNGEVTERHKKGMPSVIRFKMPEKEVSFIDLVRGKISFDMALAGDIVIAKDTKNPLYNFAVVVDDHTMQISHVIRGEDHIANTPKQIMFQEALGFPSPHYAHIPLILDAQRKKLSKRDAVVGIKEYRESGYLPEAMINFMALLGWHPGDDREILSLEELAKEFSLDRVQKGGAIFNLEKLEWINNQYIRGIPNKKLLALINELTPLPKTIKEEQQLKIIELIKERMKRLTDVMEDAGFFFALPEYDSSLLIWKKTPPSVIKENIAHLKEKLQELPEAQFKKESLEAYIKPIAEARGRGEVLWPLRAALSGSDASPGPFEILDVLGKEESLTRLDIALDKIRTIN